MSRANEERYVFETEWFDIQASLIRKYLFTFYPADNTIEMVSHYQNIKVSKKKYCWLKRRKYVEINQNDRYVDISWLSL